MSSLAEIHLRQGRSFLRVGDAGRAVELLEKARALARDDKDMLRAATAELASAYDLVGQHERASRCREQLAQFGGNAGAAAGGEPSEVGPPIPRRRIRLVPSIAIALMLVLL